MKKILIPMVSLYFILYLCFNTRKQRRVFFSPIVSKNKLYYSMRRKKINWFQLFLLKISTLPFLCNGMDLFDLPDSMSFSAKWSMIFNWISVCLCDISLNQCLFVKVRSPWRYSKSVVQDTDNATYKYLFSNKVP